MKHHIPDGDLRTVLGELAHASEIACDLTQRFVELATDPQVAGALTARADAMDLVRDALHRMRRAQGDAGEPRPGRSMTLIAVEARMAVYGAPAGADRDAAAVMQVQRMADGLVTGLTAVAGLADRRGRIAERDTALACLDLIDPGHRGPVAPPARAVPGTGLADRPRP